MIRIVILSLILVLNLSVLVGQQPNLRVSRYALEEGLSHRLVTRIKKDHLGFVWLATPNGLNRYDGYEFLHFSSGEGVKYPISADYIGEIELIANDKMAIIYKNNLTRFDFFDPASFEVQPIIFEDILGVSAKVLSIATVENGLVYFIWKEHNKQYLSSVAADGSTNLLFDLSTAEVNWSEQLSLFSSTSGEFFILDQLNGLFLLDVNKSVHTVPIENIAFNKETPLSLNFLKEDKKGRIWLSIAKNIGVFRYEQSSRQFKLFSTPLGAASIPRMWEDKLGNLLFGQSRALEHPMFSNFYMLDEKEQWSDLSYFKDLGQFIVDIQSDNFLKTTLFATVSGFKIAVNKSSIIKTMLNVPKGSGKQEKVIRGIVSIDEETVVIADEDDTWYILDMPSDSIKKLELKDHKTGEPISLNCSNQLYFDNVSGMLWGAVCNNAGKYKSSFFLKVNPKDWTVEKFYFPKRIRSFCRMDAGNFWLICSNNSNDMELFSFNPKTNAIQAFMTAEKQNPLRNGTPNFLQKSKFGHLWLGTYKGLYAIDVQKNRVDYYDQASGLSSNQIQALLEVDEKKVLIGTNKGLDYYDFNDNSKEIFNKNNGLSANQIYGIIDGKEKGTYWISTILGLNYFDLKTKSFLKFFERDGFTSNEFNRFAHFKDEAGRFYFGGVNGFNIFKQKDLLNTVAPPKVMLTNVQFFNGKTNKNENRITNLYDLKQITLHPKDKYLNFSFMLPDFADPSNNQYQVKLDGYDEDWVYLGNKNSVRYSSLPSGNYELNIKGASSKGNWTQESRTVDITVLKAFYQTWQFWLLVSLLLSVLISFFNKYQLNQKLKVERLRTKLSSDLHDEVSGLLSGIAMQSELLEMVTTDENNKAKLGSMAKVSRSAMSRMSDVIWSIDSRKDKVEDLLVRMSEHAMDILGPLDIEWKLEVKNIDQSSKMPVLLRENIYFIFKEAINNIGKHADTTKVHIRFGNFDKQFNMTIYNNGHAKNSIKKSNKKGQGTANMEMRAQKIEATLTKEMINGYTVTLTRKPFA